MPKSFEYKDAKNIINYYNDFLNNLKNSENIKNTNYNNLNIKANTLIRIDYFSIIIENCLNGKEIPINDKELFSLIKNIYIYKKSCTYVDLCDECYNSYSGKIEKYISDLSNCSNTFLWLFSSKSKKNNAEEAYKELEKLKNSEIVRSANDALNMLNSLADTDDEIVKNDFINNRENYKKYASKNINTINLICCIKKFDDNYDNALKKVKDIKTSFENCKKDIKETIEKYFAFELVNTLRGISVEELSRDKSGIKTKYLIDAGYNNLADILGASPMEIASIYGISQDKAYTIKNKCDSYAKEMRKEIKIKLSIDNKSKESTKIVKNICSYINIENCLKQINKIDKEYGNQIESSIYNLKSIGNGLAWLFMSNDKQEELINDYKYVKNTLNQDYILSIKEIYKQHKYFKINEDESWNEFSNNSIKFYNVIEEIMPGVLGNDDSIYGLPEELARKIQDECFFPDGLLCTLRKYQEWGVKYILHQEKVLLGDEMGLGKTVQAIATMVSLKNTGATHFLVVCPTSVVSNWCREIVKHSRLRVTKIHGNNKSSSFKSWLKTGGVAVTNFESTSYINLDENFKLSLLIVDEAHFIKNPSARRSINTRLLASYTDRILFMTGTALENNVDEMISLISVLNPTLADSIKDLSFMSTAPQFREKIASVYYRRKREDVLTELPDKIETKEWCTMNPEEEEVYENAILGKRFQEARRLSWNIDDLNKSSKAIRLKEIVEEAESEGRKVLVFSFFLDTIYKIHEFLKGKCLNPINGSVNVNRRQEIIDEFDNSPAGTVLLAQITSGGTGLNIQSASVVVICEPQFKPSIENQAISRFYRMAQTRNVLVYRLLCEDTIDERLINILEEKQMIFDTFADKSVAAQKTIEIDDKTFGDIIKEEIDRINQKRGTITNNINISNDEINFNEDNKCQPTKIDDSSYYKMIMCFSYDELVGYLLKKYGQAKYDYFVNENCVSTNKNVKRTNEGLFCHHIDEDKAILLSDPVHAQKNPFAYQKADRLVYCNFLEHLLLHILIIEKPKDINANADELLGIGGAVNFMCKQLNDLYNGYIPTLEWLNKAFSLVEDYYSIYIAMLKRLWIDISRDTSLSFMYKKIDLARGGKKNVYDKILDDLNKEINK